ncbi:hypothetical protein, partial [Escherichia coli]
GSSLPKRRSNAPSMTSCTVSRFLGSYSNNIDEFYKVRFAELKRRIIISEEQDSNSHSRHLLGKIQARVLKADQEFDDLQNEL